MRRNVYFVFPRSRGYARARMNSAAFGYFRTKATRFLGRPPFFFLRAY